jgi:hypothetical protein
LGDIRAIWYYPRLSYRVIKLTQHKTGGGRGREEREGGREEREGEGREGNLVFFCRDNKNPIEVYSDTACHLCGGHE